MNQFVFFTLSLVSLPSPHFLPFHWPWLAIPLVALDTSDGGSGQPEQPLSLFFPIQDIKIVYQVCTFG